MFKRLDFALEFIDRFACTVLWYSRKEAVRRNLFAPLPFCSFRAFLTTPPLWIWFDIARHSWRRTGVKKLRWEVLDLDAKVKKLAARMMALACGSVRSSEAAAAKGVA